MRECKECGKQYEGNFCPYCGAKWTEEAPTERVCPDCGERVAAGMRFCANCGFDFSKKKSSEEVRAEKRMQAAMLRTASFMEAIPAMLRIGNAVLSAIFAVLLWILFALPVTSVLGQNIGNLYQFMSGTTVLGELLGAIDALIWVVLLAFVATCYALYALYASVAERKEEKAYIKHCVLNLVFLVFPVFFLAVGCIARSKVTGFGLTAGPCSVSLIVCSAVFLAVLLALCIPAFILTVKAKAPLTPEERAEKEARKAALIAKAKRIAKPVCALGAVALTVIIVVSVSTNIFRAGKVDNIAIGDSEQAVLDVLGEPYERSTEKESVYADYVRAPHDTVWKYYSKEYTDIFDKLNGLSDKAENADSLLDIGGLVGVGEILGGALSAGEDALKIHYKYIEVAFKDGAVVAVYLDKDRTALEDYAEELKQKSTVSTLSFIPFEYTGCNSSGYGRTQLTVKYADGSYANDLVSVEKQQSQLIWSDFKGEHTYTPQSSAWDGTVLGTLKHRVEEVDVIITAATCTENGTRCTEQCSVCGQKLTTETIPATGHTPTAVDIIQSPTCTENGTRCTEQCSVCGQKLTTEVIPATGHKNKNDTCSVCSVVLSLGDSTHIRVDAKGKADATGTYILFGEYPQSVKEENVTLTATQDARGYYLGSDGFYYAKVTADSYDSDYTFSSGAKVTDGTVYYFKVEPIRWRILSESGGNALILCDSIIANRCFDYDRNNYKDSEIRAWLNGQFYETAFSDLQKALVNTVTVDNSVASTSHACENTSDKVFLLSYAEVTNPDYGFSDNTAQNTARQKQVSDYARATGAYMSTSAFYHGNGYWWLRSPYGSSGDYARDVFIDGNVDHDNVYISGVRDAHFGVAPALQIRLR